MHAASLSRPARPTAQTPSDTATGHGAGATVTGTPSSAGHLRAVVDLLTLVLHLCWPSLRFQRCWRQVAPLLQQRCHAHSRRRTTTPCVTASRVWLLQQRQELHVPSRAAPCHRARTGNLRLRAPLLAATTAAGPGASPGSPQVAGRRRGGMGVVAGRGSQRHPRLLPTGHGRTPP